MFVVRQLFSFYELEFEPNYKIGFMSTGDEYARYASHSARYNPDRYWNTT